MKIQFTELGDNLDHNGTTFHYGVVTHKGNPYDFSLCEMYNEDSETSTFELSVIECDEEVEIESRIDEFSQKLLYTQALRRMGKGGLYDHSVAMYDDLINARREAKKGIWPHEEDEKYLGETEEFVYFNDEAYNAPVMYRKEDNKKYSIEDIVSGELISDVKVGKFIKISPDFIYDYNEILKEGSDFDDKS